MGFYLGKKDVYIEDHLISFGIIDQPLVPNPHTGEGWAKCLSQLNYDADIVFIGDSITFRNDWQEAFPNKTVVNLGCPGDSIKQVTNRIEEIQSVHPEKIFVQCGINTVNNYTMNKAISDYNLLLSSLHDLYPNSKIYVQNCLPIAANYIDYKRGNDTISEFNIKIQNLCDEYNYTYIDLFSKYIDSSGNLPSEYTDDGLHIKDEYYQTWEDSIENYIYE